MIAGYPRNQVLISDDIKNIYLDEENRDRKKDYQFLKKINGGNKKMIFICQHLEKVKFFFENFDRDDFQMFLEENNILFCIKLHPKSKLNEEFRNIQSENIMVINKDADPYVFLKMADVLITDYSSIYFDYLLLDRPIIFFAYDLEEYLNDSREMYFDYDEFTPGEKVNDYQELKSGIVKVIYYSDQYKEARNLMRNYVFDYDISCNNIVFKITELGDRYD